eukprot:11180687-Lingulodinium_polyedra.AAC.1
MPRGPSWRTGCWAARAVRLFLPRPVLGRLAARMASGRCGWIGTPTASATSPGVTCVLRARKWSPLTDRLKVRLPPSS